MPPYNKTNLEKGLASPEKLPVGWPWRLLIFTIILFGTAVGGYLGMKLGYEPYLKSKINNLDEEISGLTKVVGEEEQKQLSLFYSQLINIEDLLNSHIYPSKLLNFLEKNTYSKVFYDNLNFSIKERSLTLNGNAFDYKTLAQQIKLFQDLPDIENVFLESSILSENETIKFSIKLIIKTEFLKQSL
ncbi:PilN domain-containing protein [Candidatus Wolfebacteria bacterium]|nr:PilN domain-containing protein [Candidatus Wolfebacteria bacterium]